jgi:GcrA cell cycle regulator
VAGMSNHVNTVWTDEQAEALTGHLVLGMSMAEIAEALNEKFNTSYSRNAACGKAFRLGLKAPGKPKTQPKPQPYGQRPKRRRYNRYKTGWPCVDMPIKCIEIIPGNVALVDLAIDGCRYPVNDISPFLFCNHPQLEGSSYCPGHYQLSIRTWIQSRSRKMEVA